MKCCSKVMLTAMLPPPLLSRLKNVWVGTCGRYKRSPFFASGPVSVTAWRAPSTRSWTFRTEIPGVAFDIVTSDMGHDLQKTCSYERTFTFNDISDTELMPVTTTTAGDHVVSLLYRTVCGSFCPTLVSDEREVHRWIIFQDSYREHANKLLPHCCLDTDSDFS